MRKQAYPIAKVTSGLDVELDALFITDVQSPHLRNIRFDQGWIRKGLGWRQFSTSVLDGTSMLIDTFPRLSGAVHYMFATPKWVYEYQVGGTFTVLNSLDATQMVAGWTNSGYDTFTTATKDITSAINTAGTAEHGLGTSITVVVGQRYRFTATLTLNSGQAPTISGTAGFPATTLVAGVNTMEFTADVAALDLDIFNTAVANWSCVFVMYKINMLTGDEDDTIVSAVTLTSAGADLYIITNGKDYMQKWTGSGAMADLAGWVTATTTGKYLAIFQSRLIVANVTVSGTNNPWRVQWSVVANPEDCTGTGSGFVDLVDTPDWIIGLCVLKGKLYVFKERSIWELVYVGGTRVFSPVLRIDGVGTYATKAIVNLGEEIMFYGADNVYLYDGIDLTPKGKSIYPYLYETSRRLVNASKANRVPAAYIEELQDYVMCLPTVGEVLDLWATYSFTTDSWVLRDKSFTAVGFYTVAPSTLWSGLTGDWTAQTWVWMDKALPSGAPTTLFGTANGTIWEDDRITTSTDYMTFQTKDFMFNHAHRWTEIRVVARYGPFTVYYSTDGGLTWVGPKTFAYAADWTEHKWDLYINSQKIRIRIDCYASSLDIKWIEPWYIPRFNSVATVSGS